MENDKGSYSWWWDSYNCPQNSQWLQFTLSDLDQHTKAILTLMQEDGDSFAQRAETYYRRRPELVKMVEEFHRSYRSLAERYDQLTERYDQLKSESTHVLSPSSSPSNSLKQLQNPHTTRKKAQGSSVDSKLESPNSNPESVVEDPDLESNSHISHLDLPIEIIDGLEKGQRKNFNLIRDHQMQNSGKPDLEVGINSMETKVDDPKSNCFELGHETVENYSVGTFLKRESLHSTLQLADEDPESECKTLSSLLDLPNETTDGWKKGQPPNLNGIDDYQTQKAGKPDLEIGINFMETEVVDHKNNRFEYGDELVENFDVGKFLERLSLDSDPESVEEDPNIESNTHISHLDLPNESTDVLRTDQPPNLNLIDDHQIQNSGKLNLEVGIKSMETRVVDLKSNCSELGHETVEIYGVGDFLEKESMWPELRFQVSRLLEENLKQKEELIRLNDEKREAIEELCTMLETLMEENRALQKYVRDSKVYDKQNTSSLLRFKGRFKRLGGGSACVGYSKVYKAQYKCLGGCSACVGDSNVYNEQKTSKLLRFKRLFKGLPGGCA